MNGEGVNFDLLERSYSSIFFLSSFVLFCLLLGPEGSLGLTVLKSPAIMMFFVLFKFKNTSIKKTLGHLHLVHKY